MYSNDLRLAAIKIYLEKGIRSFRRIAFYLCVSKSTVHRWVTGSPFVRRRDSRRKVTLDVLAKCHALVSNSPFLSLAHIIDRLVCANVTSHLSRSTISSILRSPGFSRKRCSLLPFQDARVAQKRASFGRELSHISCNQVICIDETAIQFDMMPRYGYAPRTK